MVGLDMSEIDEDLIRYSFFISNVIQQVETIFFVHIENQEDSVPEIQELYPEIQLNSTAEFITNKIKDLVDKYNIMDRQVEVFVRVVQGDPLTKILHLSKVHQIDMIVTGRKNILEGSGLLAVKIARRALCSVLCIPEKSKNEITKIFIPIDFSDFSHLAMDYALSFAKDNSIIEIVCQHIYKLPKGYLTSGKSQEEFAEIMLENAKRNYANFIGHYDLGNTKVSIRYSLDAKNVATKMTYNNALVEQADFIMLASRGRTNAAATLLGSFAEKLLTENANLPMLVLKNKQRNLDMISALLKL